MSLSTERKRSHSIESIKAAPAKVKALRCILLFSLPQNLFGQTAEAASDKLLMPDGLRIMGSQTSRRTG